MKRFNTFCASLSLLLLSAMAIAAPVTYPGPTILDDTGAKVTPTSLTVASVTDLDGNAIAAPGAVAHFAGSNSSVVYDAAAKGEAWITLAPVLAGHTFASNPPIVFCSADSQTIAAGNTGVVAIKAQTDKLLFDGSNNLRSNIYAYNTGLSPDVLVWAATTRTLSAAQTFSNTGTWTGNLLGSVGGNVVGSVGSVTAPVVLPTTVPAGYGFSGLSGSDVTVLVTGIMGATVDGTLTFKQISALSEAFMNGRFSISDATSAPYVRTVTYYRVDGTTPLATQPTTYTDNTFSKVAPAGRAKPTFSNLP